MAIIAVFNQKGGVGRTTTALNLLAAIARRGRRPLGIDLDPQAHLSQVFGIRPRLADDSVCGFFSQRHPLADVAQITRSGIVLCPAHADLAKTDARLGRGGAAVTRLRQALGQRDTPPEPVVIDCGPLLDILALNALFACDLVLVPVSCDYLSLRAASQVERALDALEPVFGQRPARRYLLTRYCATRTISDEIVTRMAAAFRPEELCTTRIRECSSLAESPVMELDVFRHAPASSGAQDYAALDVELMRAGLVQ